MPSGGVGQLGVRSSGGDVRQSNLLRLLAALRGAPSMSRTELAAEIGLAVPSVHRLVADLVGSHWVETTGEEAGVGRGRPTTRFRFRDEVGLVLGVDVGSATTRLVVASLDNSVRARAEVVTADLREDLAAGIRAAADDLLASNGLEGVDVAAAGVGVPSVVDVDGCLTRPFLESGWAGLPLRDQLQRLFGCEVTVAQDNHFAALAEGSAGGTAHGATSVLVIELGIGIGAGFTVGGHIVSGADGALGRLMGWPCVAPRGVRPGGTLGELLTVDGLLDQYRALSGEKQVRNGVELLAAAEVGDRVARRVARWAGREFDATLRRLALLLNPAMIVVGGGLGRGLFEAGLIDRAGFDELAGTCELRASALGPDAVVVGALCAAQRLVPAWIAHHLSLAS